MGTLTVHRAPDADPPEPMPHGEIRLESPPELPERAADGLAQALMYLPMGAMAIGMVAIVAGGHASAILYVGSGAMAVGMAGMMVGQIARGRGDRKVKLNGLRRDYLRYLSQVRREGAARGGGAAHGHGVLRPGSPESLPSLVVAGRVWERTPADGDFLNVRFATGTQALALRLVPPETKPVEDLDPLCAGALRRFIRSHSSVPSLPVAVRLRSFTRIAAEGDSARRPRPGPGADRPGGGRALAGRRADQRLRERRAHRRMGLDQVAAAQHAPHRGGRGGPGPADGARPRASSRRYSATRCGSGRASPRRRRRHRCPST